MEIKKSTLQIGMVLLLLVVGGYFLLQGERSISPTGNAVVTRDIQEIIVGMKDYNYYPNTIEVESGKTVRMYLDDSVYGCFRDLEIRDFGIHEYLKGPSDYVEFTPTKPGTHVFACSMGMGTGKLVVK